MLQSMMAEKKMRLDYDFHLKGPDMKGELKGSDPWPKGEEHGILDRKEIEKIKEQARREAARSNEEFKRALREMEKAYTDQNRHQQGPVKGKQVEALRRQLERLEREKAELARQIEQLERNDNPFDEQDGDKDVLNPQPEELQEDKGAGDIKEGTTP